MRYLGLDVHTKATVYCLLSDTAEVVERGKVDTTVPALEPLVRRLSASDELLVGQEVGKMSTFVHDVVTGAQVRILSFNAHQLRMISASRKKTDKRDSYWIAKALQTGMMPHPVYIPTGQVRELRGLLSQRQALSGEHKRWLLRARSYLEAAGYKLSRHRTVVRLVESAMAEPEGLDEPLAQALERCERMEAMASSELRNVEATIRREASSIDAIRRLKTIPAVGDWVSVSIYAWVGDVRRFPNARALASYAGLVPSVHQSGESQHCGRITKQGTGQLRSALVQAGHVLMFRCRSAEAAPLQAIAKRIHTARARRKIAVVAAARHLLRIAYYVLRDGTEYDPQRLRQQGLSSAVTAA